MFMLTMNIYQALGDLFQNGDGHQATIEAALRLAARTGQFARYQKSIFVFICVQPGLSEPPADLGGSVREIEHGFHRRPSRSGADQITAGPLPECQPKRINNNGLPSTRFAGEDIQSRPERQVQMVNQRKVGDMEFNEHLLSIIPIHVLNLGCEILVQRLAPVELALQLVVEIGTADGEEKGLVGGAANINLVFCL